MEGRPSAASGTISPRDSRFEVNDWVWSPDANVGYRRSRVVSVDDGRDSLCVDHPEGGAVHVVRKSELRPFYDVGETRTFQDNTEMVHLDDANILDNLRKRYVKDEIYTYTANVLLAVNPYKDLLQLYTKEVMSKYWGKNPGTLPPHPFAISDVAYRQMLRDRKNQALVISGESGAGKTETAKITMRYLTSMSRTDAAQGSRIQEKIIMANPILESFGNATTVMNLNSSRFGKYNEMMFNPVGSLVGAGIKTFLLESSRVVSQQKGEKNYHVFYELLAGMEEEALSNLWLERDRSYKLLHASGAPPQPADARRLATQFQELRQALSIFLDEETQDHIWQTLAALIHLGEVDFQELEASDESEKTGERGEFLEPSPSHCSATPSSAAAASAADAASAVSAEALSTQSAKVEIDEKTEECLDMACDLLGLGVVSVAKVLKFREMHVNRQGRISHIKCPRTLAQARQTLQCIIKILYKRLFDKIVSSINEVSNSGAARQSEGNYHNIGTLDIYGFERLESNSFEQLCINLANERLQQFFVEEVLEAEQRMYRDERLNVHSMELPDSAPVVSGIHSVLRLLDEHSLRAVKNLVREGALKDSKFCEQVYRELIDAKQPSHRGTILALKLKASRTDRGPSLHDGFQIAHYAGAVSYSTKGWIDKNNDSLVPEIEAILADADRSLIADMADRSRCQSGNGGERLCSVSSKYLSNLTNLLDTLKKCSVHYIRCFNPNQERKAGLFKPKYVLDQVIQCGTVELVNIMHHGYPHRCILRDLRARFQKLLPPEFAHYSDRDFMHAVMLAWEIDDSQWTLGTSRLFLKAGQLRALEELRDIGGQASQHVIKKIRQQFAKKKLRAFAHAIELVSYLRRIMLQGKRERTYAGLRRAIRFMVRVNRWKNRALRRLVPFNGMDEEQEAIFTRKLGVGFQTMSLNLNATMLPQLFVTMGAADMPLIHAKHQKEMTSEEYDASWQAEAQESVLYFNDGVLKCAKLLGGAFAATTRTSAGAICDVRVVDCCSSGRAFAVSTAPELEKLRCICQSHENSQMFAHCERSNTIMLWRWMGATKPNQPVVAAIASFKLPAYWQVYQMCFLPANPARPGEHVLAILGRMHDCNWLAISVYTVSRGRIALNTIKNVYLNLLDEALQNEGASISHFNLSHSGRTLILAGNRLLRLYSVGLAATGMVELDDLDPQQDCEAHILGRDPHGTVTAVCALPMDPDSRSPGFLDWIWLGVSSGDMFGILLEESNGTISVATSSGRFRRNTHSQGVPIQAIVAVHEPLEGDPRSLHHSLTMRKPMMNPNAVLSISADGKLLHSERRSHQWQPVAEWQVPLSLEALRCGFAARCSALIPQVLLLADEGRQCLIAYDQRQPVNSGMSMCSFV